MIHCLCNNLRTSCVRRAIEAGARRPQDVHRHHGHRVNCGRCLASIAEEISEAALKAPAAPSLATPEAVMPLAAK